MGLRGWEPVKLPSELCLCGHVGTEESHPATWGLGGLPVTWKGNHCF